jgi:hypothetical protein
VSVASLKRSSRDESFENNVDISAKRIKQSHAQLHRGPDMKLRVNGTVANITPPPSISSPPLQVSRSLSHIEGGEGNKSKRISDDVTYLSPNVIAEPNFNPTSRAAQGLEKVCLPTPPRSLPQWTDIAAKVVFAEIEGTSHRDW